MPMTKPVCAGLNMVTGIVYNEGIAFRVAESSGSSLDVR
jgi:hypothetical protein